jgi:colicin import membrane protein
LVVLGPLVGLWNRGHTPKVSLATAVSTADAIGRVGEPLAPSDERHIPGEGEPSSGDAPRDPVAGAREARESVEGQLRDAVERMRAEVAGHLAELTAAGVRNTQEAVARATEAARDIAESRGSMAEARVAETINAQLSVIDGSFAARTEAATADMAARLRQEFGTSFKEWRSEARAEIGDATREAALALVEERAASARKALGKQNDATLMSINEQALREVKRRGAKLEKRLRSEIGDRLATSEEDLARSVAKDQAELAAELQDEIESRLNAARTEVAAEVAQGIAEASERISGELRTELAAGVSDAERTLDNRAATRIADHTSRLIEQAAQNSASLAERARDLADESLGAAEEIARKVASAESDRRFGELGRRLEERIEVAENASRDEAARVRSELEDVNAEAARKRLDDALERVRAEGATQLQSQRQSLVAEARTTRSALDEVVEATRVELRETVGSTRSELEEVVANGRSDLGALAEGLERRAQRRDLKLAKAETSKRIKGALSELENERGKIDAAGEEAATRLRAQADEVTAQAENRLNAHADEAGREVAGGGERLADALRRVEETVAGVEESSRRISELERRAGVAEQEAARSAEMARNAVELEARMREALKMEAAAAEQIAIAERRLIDFIVHH